MCCRWTRRRCAVRLPGERVRVEVSSSHYSARPRENVILQWRLSGMDGQGRIHADLARGGEPIRFPHRRVVPVATVEFALPDAAMLCKLTLRAVDARDGEVIAENYVEYLVSPGYPATSEQTSRRETILRLAPADWAAAEWSEQTSDRAAASEADACHGGGSGFFEWDVPLARTGWRDAKRLRVLCEASSRRPDTPQTSLDLFPSHVADQAQRYPHPFVRDSRSSA